MSNPQGSFNAPQNPGQPPRWGGPQQPGQPVSSQQPAWSAPQHDPAAAPQYPQSGQPGQAPAQPQWAGQNSQHAPAQQWGGQPQQPGFTGGPTPPQGSGPNKTLLIGGIIAGAVALIVIIGLVVALMFSSRSNNNNVNDPNSGGNNPGTSQEQPGTENPGNGSGEEPAQPTTGNWTGDDALYQQTLDILDSPYTLEEAKEIAFLTCDTLASNPTSEQFINTLLGGTTNSQVAYDRGAAAGAGVVVYCPEYEELMYELSGS